MCPFAVRSQDALPAEAFLGSRLRQTPGGRNLQSASGLGCAGLFSPAIAYLLAPGRPSPGPAFTPASPLRVVTHILWCGNVRPLPIAYALRPRLRVRLTQGGRACPWNPQAFGAGDSHPRSRILVPASSLPAAPREGFHPRFSATGTLPYHRTLSVQSAASATVLSPDHYRRRRT